MMQKTWFKLFIWFISISFFFLAASIIISVFGPEPDEQKSMLFMTGMDQAMQNSLMGLSMSLEGDTALSIKLRKLTDLTIPLVLYSAAGALLIKLRRSRIDR